MLWLYSELFLVPWSNTLLFVLQSDLEGQRLTILECIDKHSCNFSHESKLLGDPTRINHTFTSVLNITAIQFCLHSCEFKCMGGILSTMLWKDYEVLAAKDRVPAIFENFLEKIMGDIGLIASVVIMLIWNKPIFCLLQRTKTHARSV